MRRRRRIDFDMTLFVVMCLLCLLLASYINMIFNTRVFGSHQIGGSTVVECLSRDRGAAGSRLTGITVCVLEQSKKGGKDRNRYNQVPHLTQDLPLLSTGLA